ncbi:MAG: polyphosphate kinase 2 family protein [Thermoanaerobaculia bacterium]|nr:polyphosphate kinase 2 family protein [Thermoanaerobaculia bacterium]
MSIREKLRVSPGQKIHLDDIDPDQVDGIDDKSDAKRDLREEVEKISDLQEALYAESKQALLVVFQALDAGGKDGTIRSVFSGINPQGCHVTSFKAPSTLERSHDFLWRIHQAVPRHGTIGVFNRSQYEDVLIVRVDNLAPKSVWKPRYEQINHFEALLTSARTRVIKFYLHISRDEQKERFQERLDMPEKHWKFSAEDLEKRKQWNDYRKAFEDVLERCSTEEAPWYIIPANRNWVRNLAVARVLRETLEEMDPQYPTLENFDPSSYVID